MSKDIDLIVFGLLLVLTVIWMDDGAGQRWCDTYQQFCEEATENDTEQED